MSIRPHASEPPSTGAGTHRPGASRRLFIGLVVGVICGLVANRIGGRTPLLEQAVSVADIVGNLFLRLLFVMVVPLVVSALALAVAEIGDLGKLGRLGLATLAVTVVLSSSAVLIGVGLVNLIRPGDALAAARGTEADAGPAAETERVLTQATGIKKLRDIVIDMIPQNPLQEMVGAIDGSSKGNGMLAVMVFALLLGAAIAANPETCRPLMGWLEAWNTVAMTVIGWGMAFAPVGAGCLVFATVARLGFDALVSLFWFAFTVLAGFAIRLVIVYPTVLRTLSQFQPLDFFRRSAEAIQVAFGLILGVDRLLDMCRTVLNVTGDLVVAACVAGPSGRA